MISKINYKISNKDYLRKSLYQLRVTAKAYEVLDVKDQNLRSAKVKDSKLKNELVFSEARTIIRNIYIHSQMCHNLSINAFDFTQL